MTLATLTALDGRNRLREATAVHYECRSYTGRKGDCGHSLTARLKGKSSYAALIPPTYSRTSDVGRWAAAQRAHSVCVTRHPKCDIYVRTYASSK